MSQSNGHGPAAPPQLLKLLAKHERIVASIRETLDALGVHQTKSVTTRATQTLSEALALDEQRVAGRHRAPKGSLVPTITRRRRRTEALLARFNPDTPTMLETNAAGRQAVGSMVRYGYLKPKGDGFVRTAKEFSAKK